MNHNVSSGRYHFQQTVTAGAASDPVLLPSVYHHNPGYAPAAVYASPGGGGTARIEFSLSTPEEVEAGSATWLPWPDGDVSAGTVRTVAGPVTALRCVATTANAAWGVMR